MADDKVYELKRLVGHKVLEYIPSNCVLGIGSGSTVSAFIDELGKAQIPLKGIVAASKVSEEKLRAFGYEIVDLNSVDEMAYYIDGADEVNELGVMIKGGGAALTREKIIATVAKSFICIVDESKIKSRLGDFPLPVEVIPMARSYVARKILSIGGQPNYRTGVMTDNGNVILDIKNLDLTDALKIENDINLITGVVENGLFAKRRANVILSAKTNGEVNVIKVK